jgi:hypothetical protein
MPKRANRNKTKLVIPEPSPRFALWSGIAMILLIVVVLAIDYANGWAR